MPRIRLGRKRSRKRSALNLLRELPNFLKLLVRLMRDGSVSKVDRALFGAVIAYVLLPIDLLPDFLGFMGWVDDLFLIGISLNRLFQNAGADTLLEHWDGNPRALGYLLEGVEEIGELLPKNIRNALRRLV
ncbi:MAG TPA: DUF1232 domain-containing protein [Longimicrobiales bacterium]